MNTKHLSPITLLLLLFTLSPSAQQKAPTPRQESVYSIAGHLRADNLTVGECDKARDEQVCLWFENQLGALLAIDKEASGESKPCTEPGQAMKASAEERAREIAGHLERLLPKIVDEKAGEAVKGEIAKLKGDK